MIAKQVSCNLEIMNFIFESITHGDKLIQEEAMHTLRNLVFTCDSLDIISTLLYSSID